MSSRLAKYAHMENLAGCFVAEINQMALNSQINRISTTVARVPYFDRKLQFSWQAAPVGLLKNDVSCKISQTFLVTTTNLKT